MEESIKNAIQTEEMILDLSGKRAMDAHSYSPLSLAYIGDSVFDLMVKSRIVSKVNMQTQKYHKKVSQIVKAGTQAMLIERLLADNVLREDEVDIYKRGRNATTHTKARNASMGEYRKATGFEALLGYLYLSGNLDRLNQIFEQVIRILESDGF